jgi:hydroxyethylthiazole kinase
MNVTANALLAIGASPVMAHAPEEVEEMTSVAQALVLNLGTLSAPWIESMVKAGQTAVRTGIPIVLEPVGSGATQFRTRTAQQLIRQTRLHHRGNASEIARLFWMKKARKGWTAGTRRKRRSKRRGLFPNAALASFLSAAPWISLLKGGQPLKS